MNHFQVFVELKWEKFLPEPHRDSFSFYTRIQFGDQEVSLLAGGITTLADHKHYYGVALPAIYGNRPPKWETRAAPKFLVRKYNEAVHFELLSAFFEGITTGSNPEEMTWKCAHAFGFADFWEWYPIAFDMQQSTLEYRLEPIRLEMLDSGKSIPWTDLAPLIRLSEPVRIWVDLALSDQSIPLYQDLYPLEAFYSMLHDKLAAAGPYLLNQDRVLGSETLDKAAMEEQIHLTANSFDGNTIEEVLLKVGTLFNFPDSAKLLGMPLSPGGPYTLSPNPIRTDYNAVLE